MVVCGGLYSSTNKSISLSDAGNIIILLACNLHTLGVRVNDCDKTRVVQNTAQSREHQIITQINEIDFMIFNSYFIQDYYLKRFEQSNILVERDKYTVIINGCDQGIFINMNKTIQTKVKIVTHHWSDNMNKGYQMTELCKDGNCTDCCGGVTAICICDCHGFEIHDNES